MITIKNAPMYPTMLYTPAFPDNFGMQVSSIRGKSLEGKISDVKMMLASSPALNHIFAKFQYAIEKNKLPISPKRKTINLK